MRRLTVVSSAVVLAITVFGVGSAAARPARLGASCAGAIPWTRASSYIGRVVTVKGPVVATFYATSSNGEPTFLNIGRDYASPRRFTVVIWTENRARFGRPERRYARRTVCVNGRVTSYRGVPEIEARSPSQITIAG